jgi:hypothetical protein
MVRFYFFTFVGMDNGNDGMKHVMDRYKKQHVTKAKTNSVHLLLAFQIIEIVVVLYGCLMVGKMSKFCVFVTLFISFS